MMEKNDDLMQGIRNWNEYAAYVKKLRAQSCIRTNRDPRTDFGEWLVATYYKVELPDNPNQKGVDLTVGKRRIQVKTINKAPTTQRQGYIIKSKDKTTDATHFAFVFFTDYKTDGFFLCDARFVSKFERKTIKREDLEGVNPMIEKISIP